MNKWDEPSLTDCTFCAAKTAAMPGPRWRRGRPLPPAGYRIGYFAEQVGARDGDEREFIICDRCLAHVLQTAA